MRFMLFLMVLFSVNSFAMDIKASEQQIKNARPKGTSLVKISCNLYYISELGQSLSRDKSGSKTKLSISAGNCEGMLSVIDSSVKEFQGVERGFWSKKVSLNYLFNSNQYEKFAEMLKSCINLPEESILNNYQNSIYVYGTVYWPNESLKKVLSDKSPAFNVNIEPNMDFYCGW